MCTYKYLKPCGIYFEMNWVHSHTYVYVISILSTYLWFCIPPYQNIVFKVTQYLCHIFCICTGNLRDGRDDITPSPDDGDHGSTVLKAQKEKRAGRLARIMERASKTPFI